MLKHVFHLGALDFLLYSVYMLKPIIVCEKPSHLLPQSQLRVNSRPILWDIPPIAAKQAVSLALALNQ